MPWTAINGPGQGTIHAATQVPTPNSPTEPPKKRRKKQKEDGLPSLPKSTKSREATGKQPKIRKSSRRINNVESSETRSPSRVVLSETTRNKSIGHRKDALPTPASEGVHSHEANKENIVSRVSAVTNPLVTNPESRASDPLSDDLWKNQQRQPEYPWLYRNNDFSIDAPSVNGEDGTESQIFAQMVEMSGQKQNNTESDSLVNNQELERLMDEMMHEEPITPTESEVATLRYSSTERLLSTIGEVDDDVFDWDNFDLEDDELDFLCKATVPLMEPLTVGEKSDDTQLAKRNHNQDLRAQKAKNKTTAKGKVPPGTMYQRTRRSKASPTKPNPPKMRTLEEGGFETNQPLMRESRQKVAAYRNGDNKSAQNNIDATDLDDTDFQDLLELITALPDSPPLNPVQPQTLRNSAGETSIIPHIDPTDSPPPSAATAPIANSKLPENPPPNIQHRFIRSAHPSLLSTPSPIPGLTPRNQILTCFRLGEVINASIHFQRQNLHHQQPHLPSTTTTTTTTTTSCVTIEFYARVIHSIREGPIQTFRFVDLYSTADKPGIILEGRWEGWQRSELWKEDGQCFWEDSLREVQGRPVGRKARVIGRLVRNGNQIQEQSEGQGQGQGQGKWMVDILSVWAAGWDDVLFTRDAVL